MQNTSKPRIAVLDFQEQGCIPGTGRSTAERIASRLGGFPHYRVVERTEWMRRIAAQNRGYIAGGELREDCRFHPAWAAERLALLGLDAVVIGRLRQSSQGRIFISAMLVDGSGIVLRRLEETSADKVAHSLSSRRFASAIRLHRLPFPAKVECVRGPSLIARVEEDCRLRPKDRIRVDRTLESIPDPYLEDDSRAFAYLTAPVGEAEVIEVSGHFLLARYSGSWVPQSGENLSLVKI